MVLGARLLTGLDHGQQASVPRRGGGLPAAGAARPPGPKHPLRGLVRHPTLQGSTGHPAQGRHHGLRYWHGAVLLRLLTAGLRVHQYGLAGWIYPHLRGGHLGHVEPED